MTFGTGSCAVILPHEYAVHLEEEEVTGLWVAAVPSMPGVVVYGDSMDEAYRRVTHLADTVRKEFVESQNA